MEAVLSEKHNLMLNNIGFSSDYYLSGNKSTNNHDIIFLAGLMIILAVIVLAFVVIYYSHLVLEPKNLLTPQRSTTYSDIYV